MSVRVSPFKLRPVSMSYCRTRIVDMRSQCATIPGPRGAGLGPRKLCTVILRSVISSSVILGGVLCAIGLFSSPVSGQQVTTGVNNVGVGHSFNENFGVGFNAQFGGGNVVGFLNNPGGVQSPFGGFDPGAGRERRFPIWRQRVFGKFEFLTRPGKRYHVDIDIGLRHHDERSTGNDFGPGSGALRPGSDADCQRSFLPSHVWNAATSFDDAASRKPLRPAISSFERRRRPGRETEKPRGARRGRRL